MKLLRTIVRTTGLMATAGLIAGCTGSGSVTSSGSVSPSTSTGTPVVTPSPTVDPASSPSVQDNFIVGEAATSVALVCWGEGSPTVILETGGPNIEQWTGSGLVRELAPATRVCTYDRPGTGASDPPPNERRDADDVITVLHDLLDAAAITGPHVLVGRSFGGMIVTHYADELPQDVVGVVVLDTPAPSSDMTEASEPELVWDYPGNTERLDVVNGFENRFANDPPQIDAPLLVITGAGESGPEDGTFWLQLASDGEHIAPGCLGDPTARGSCSTAILQFVQRVASGSG